MNLTSEYVSPASLLTTGGRGTESWRLTMQSQATMSARLCPVCAYPLPRVNRTYCSQSCLTAARRSGMVRSPESRFWEKVNKTETCWLWTGSRGGDYGSFVLNGSNQKAHRVSWEWANGLIPDGLLVCHQCDQRLCVRPDHLFLGTQQENVQDCVRKGRHWLQNNPERARASALYMRQFAPKLKSHCKRGHPMTDDNVLWVPRGNRVCATCEYERRRVNGQRRNDREKLARAQARAARDGAVGEGG